MHNSQKRFMDRVLFPRLVKDRITRVVHLGDLMDQKKYVNYLTAQRVRDDFMQPLIELGVRTTVIVGNHDIFYKDTLRQNSVSTFLRDHRDHFDIIDRPLEYDLAGLGVLMIPYIVKDNAEATAKLLKESTCPWVMGHLEIAGFGMYKGVPNEHGMNAGLLGRFERVLSGHFHHRSEKGNITYVGSTCQYSWNDHGDIRGFHVLDTETRELEFVPNPEQMFTKVFYDDGGDVTADQTLRDLAGTETPGFVKLIVKSKENPLLFERVVDILEKRGLEALQVVTDHHNITEVSDDEIAADAGDTISILMRHVDAVASVEERDALRELMSELYTDAVGIE